MEAEIGDLGTVAGASRFGRMILTCPECATSYFVDDGRIPAAGRMVKCTSCAARWRAMPEAEEPAPPEPQTEPPAAAAPQEPAPAAAPPPLDDLEIVAVEAKPAKPTLPPPRPRSGATGAIVAWSAMAATVALLVAGAIVFRADVVKLWPKSSGAYAGVGLPVNSLGLVIEQVKFQPTFQGGRPVLSVTGAIRNVGAQGAEAPPLRFDLLDRKGEPVAAKIVRPIESSIPPGERRYFAVAIVDPPSTARDLQVAFQVEPEGGEATHAESHPALPATPAAVEAQPLPSDNPDALHDHG